MIGKQWRMLLRARKLSISVCKAVDKVVGLIKLVPDGTAALIRNRGFHPTTHLASEP